MKPRLLLFVSILLFVAGESGAAQETTLSQRLLSEPIDVLARAVEKSGDPARGAIAFYQPTMNCAKCHDSQGRRLGPVLIEKREATTRHLIESVLKPSAVIHEEFQMARVATDDGRLITGVLVGETDEALVIESIEQNDSLTITKDNIEEWAMSKTSAMPVDLANQLADRQQFLDLISYLAAINGNPELQTKLKPATAAIAPLPEYESRVDHAGLIRSLNDESLERGSETYRLRCASCHGTVEAEGSMPTSLRFSSGKFKHGNDPLTMYKTLTHGYGMMNPQRWMVPQQKYEVIHYIRQHFLSQHNSDQLFNITDGYLASLPKGDTRGPKPVMSQPWTLMDYGPSMFNTIEVSRDGSNIAQKGIVVRLDSGPGGVESGSHWLMYEHDTMRVAGAWSGQFIDYEGIHFNGTHGRHPRATGEIHFANPTAPGFGRPGETSDSQFKDDRVIGRDGKHYGPLPREWTKYLGMYRFGDKSIIKYRIGNTEIHESPSLSFIDKQPVYTRHLNLGVRTEDLYIQIANVDEPATLKGNSAARIKTASDGTIFAKTRNQDEWLSQGKTLFLRGGRPTLDIGWVGAVHSDRRVDDNEWHEVVMTWNADKELVRFYVDGEEAGEGEIAPERKLPEPTVARIGFTNNNFPGDPFFEGAMSEVRFYQRELDANEIKHATTIEKEDLVGVWNCQTGSQFPEVTGNFPLIANVSGTGKPSAGSNGLAAVCSLVNATWTHDDGNLRLKVPAGAAVNIAVSQVPVADQKQATAIEEKLSELAAPQDLSRFTRGGPANYPEKLTTPIIRGDDSGPFAVDVFQRPTNNPWNAQLRLTGIDFLSDETTAIVSAWDGSVWRISGYADPESESLSWQRIAASVAIKLFGYTISTATTKLTGTRTSTATIKSPNTFTNSRWVCRRMMKETSTMRSRRGMHSRLSCRIMGRC